MDNFIVDVVNTRKSQSLLSVWPVINQEQVEKYYNLFTLNTYCVIYYNINQIVFIELDRNGIILIELITSRKDILLGTVDTKTKQISLYDDSLLLKYLLPLINRLLDYEP